MRTEYLENKKKGHSKFYKMTEISETMFEVEYGKIGSVGIKVRYPIGMWNKKYNEKMGNGYEKVSSRKIPKKVATDHVVEKQIKQIVDLIKNYKGDRVPKKEQITDLTFIKKCLYNQRESNSVSKTELQKMNLIYTKYKK